MEKFWTSEKKKKEGNKEVSNVQKSDSLSEVNASTIFFKSFYNSSYSVWSKKMQLQQ